MATERFAHKGREFVIEAGPIGDTGECWCAVYPDGDTGHGIALFSDGKVTGFHSEPESFKAGRDYIRDVLLCD
jgi:hypothetical protein